MNIGELNRADIPETKLFKPDYYGVNIGVWPIVQYSTLHNYVIELYDKTFIIGLYDKSFTIELYDKSFILELQTQ